ncbi:hypothetical protein SCG7109_AI_00060 [Chlamydiales bacterium SCGC AG-110-M15]|nr:hypothetical protein SCG7109_AI_00060 [Chlamydiales bacterium SCGC AG-110-M15]
MPLCCFGRRRNKYVYWTAEERKAVKKHCNKNLKAYYEKNPHLNPKSHDHKSSINWPKRVALLLALGLVSVGVAALADKKFRALIAKEIVEHKEELLIVYAVAGGILGLGLSFVGMKKVRKSMKKRKLRKVLTAPVKLEAVGEGRGRNVSTVSQEYRTRLPEDALNLLDAADAFVESTITRFQQMDEVWGSGELNSNYSDDESYELSSDPDG